MTRQRSDGDLHGGSIGWTAPLPFLLLSGLHLLNAEWIRHAPGSFPAAHDALDMLLHAALQTSACALCTKGAPLFGVFIARIVVEYLVFTWAFNDAFYGRRTAPDSETFYTWNQLLHSTIGVSTYIFFEALAALVGFLPCVLHVKLRPRQLIAWALPTLFHFLYIWFATAYLQTKAYQYFYAAHSMNFLFPFICLYHHGSVIIMDNKKT